MNTNYIARALCFHGQPMQKIWEDEHGAGDLQKLGLTQPNYAVYQERQKYFTFQDRAKRLKLHQFFARKASDLYSNELDAYPGVVKVDKSEQAAPFIAIMPPYEVFVNKSQDKVKRGRCLLEGIKVGDIVYGVVTKSILTSGSAVKLLCTAEPLVRYLSDVALKAYIPQCSLGPVPLDKHGKPRNYSINDFVCCEVLEVSIDADRLTLGMEGVLTKNKNIKLGLVNLDDLPAYYRKSNDNTSERFEDCLLKSKEFLNPNYDVLFEINGLNVNETFTLMNSLKVPFHPSEYYKELRQTQASKWAFRSVAEGIERFKIGHHVEAFQCLNKALSIDPQNVEGLVARGALYANKGSFVKAVEDFEKALKLNSGHANARKYMGETLVALGRSYEEENRIKEAAKAYMDCLNISPNHEQARLSLEAINQRNGNQYFDTIFNIADAIEEEKPKMKKQNSSSDSSSDSNSADSSSGSDSDSGSNKNNRKKSLSPLSKRMALHAATVPQNADPSSQSFTQPFFTSNYNINGESGIINPATVANDMNDFKLDDDDTESRVRKLLQEASKHKKEKTKKSKKKKIKKSKKDSRKEKGPNHFLEAYSSGQPISSLNTENKLYENLQIYEKTIADIKRRQEILQQSISTSVANLERQHSETPPPVPPSMKIFDKDMPKLASSTRLSTSGYSSGTGSSTAASVSKTEQPKFSFQIRRPVKVDKFGLVRIATPLTTKKSPSISRSRSRSISPSRRQYHRRYEHESPSSSRRSRRDTSSRDDYRRRRSRSRTRSRSNSRSRRGRNDSSRRRRRSPSPYRQRDRSPSPHRHRDRSPRHYSRSGRRSNSPGNSQKFGNRVWQRPGYIPTSAKPLGKSQISEGRWLHDRYKDNDDCDSSKKKLNDDGPSIEEIDEIINKAQKERKQEIIKRDKDLLKKSTTVNY